MAGWDGVQTLVTGAGGFIGGHVAVALNTAGAHVRALCRYNSRGGHGALAWFEPDRIDGIEVVLGNLRDPESVRDAMNGIETVFHLGAQIAIPYSFVNPREFLAVNAEGALNVAQAARDQNVRRVLHVSTSEVYGEAQVVPIPETHPLSPRSPYAATKVAADMVMESFQRSFALPVAIARPFNAFGPHQSARAIIPAIAIQALAGSRVSLGRLDPRRDLTYIEDTVAGLLRIAECEAAVGEVVHLGSGRDVSIGELVELIGELLGKDLQVVREEERIRPNHSEIPRLLCDCTKIHAMTGWSARIDLRDGLRRTLDWLGDNQHRFRSERYVI
ncbi:MAG: GDP-mannose 4,6-dehydratase [Solirubrobacteraceae bacterium]